MMLYAVSHLHLGVEVEDELLVVPHPHLDSSLVVEQLDLVPAPRERVGLASSDVTQVRTRQVHETAATQPHLHNLIM